MKSFIIALSIAGALIFSSCIYMHHLNALSSELCGINSEVTEFLLSDDYINAAKKTTELSDYLDKCEPFLAAMGNHTDIDNIEINIAELKRYTEGNIKYDALARSEVLSFLFSHLPKNSRFKLENIL